MADMAYKRNGEILAGNSLPAGICRVAAALEYNGTAYHGFQIQKHDPQTVQGYLHLALSEIANEDISLVCAGRTDAGVHATNQMVHFDTSAQRPSQAWLKGVNTHLPRDIRIHWAQEVKPQFHARFSAVSRRYRYIISDRKTRPGIMAGQISWSRYALDMALMQAGAKHLIGEHDFTSLRAAQCQARTPVRNIESIDFYHLGDHIMVMEIQANAFLHHMVRNIVGVLMAVGSARQPVGWVADVLAAKDRSAAEVTAPAAGLYLVAVKYPTDCGIPQFSPGPHLLPAKLG